MVGESSLSRRTVLKGTAAVLASSAIGSTAYAQSGREVIRVGLIGCGGRGVGAVHDALNADPKTEIVAVADVFEGQTKRAVAAFNKKFDKRSRITPERVFTGLDGYKKLVNCEEVDYVLIATPPKFHCHFLEAAVDAGKHVFCEKPGSSDVVGLKQVYRAAEKATKNGTGVMCGLQRRHNAGRQQLIKRLHDGALGELVSASAWWNRTGWLYLARQQAETDLGFQLRSWRPQTWLSADSPGSILIHQVDVVNWAFDAVPDECMCMGGRLVHNDPAVHGNMYDHFAAEFIYPGGRMMSAQVKTMPVDSGTKEVVYGAKGVAHIDRGIKYNDKNKKPEVFRGKGSDNVNSHICLLNSVREGKPVNYGNILGDATLVTIMMTLSAYTGKRVTRKFIMNESQWQQGPAVDDLSMDMEMPIQPVPIPGQYPLV